MTIQRILFEEPGLESRTEGERILLFSQLPYRILPFSRRNWGHSWHSLCSYQGKLKPSIAHFLVKMFTRKGDRVLDPFSGVGTIPFEACLQGRVGLGLDLNPVAYHSTKAKLNPPSPEAIDRAINDLGECLSHCSGSPSNRHVVLLKNINGRLEEYFEDATFIQILKAREYFLEKNRHKEGDSFVLASLLHILHGNRPYALSRRSHGLTPFSPTGEFVYKPLLQHLRAKVDRMLSAPLPEEFVEGEAYFGSVFDVTPGNEADVILTSPPFVKSTRFYLNNWIRLWFCGWQDEDFSSANRQDFVDELQAKDISIYGRIFQRFAEFLRPNGLCVLHLGVAKGRDMGKELGPFAERAGFEQLDLIYEDVSGWESHGLTDQGTTVHHEFLFLRKTA